MRSPTILNIHNQHCQAAFSSIFSLFYSESFFSAFAYEKVRVKQSERFTKQRAFGPLYLFEDQWFMTPLLPPQP